MMTEEGKGLIKEMHRKQEIPFNNLTSAEDERLAILAGDLAQAALTISRIQRHGYENYNPNGDFTTNKALLEKELGHINQAITMMVAKKDLNADNIKEHADAKAITRRMYLHRQPF